MVTMNKEIDIFPTADALFTIAANDFKRRALTAIQSKGLFTVALSGGNTPKLFFDAITNLTDVNDIPWANIRFFFGDERYVSPDSKDSNFHTAQTYLFSKVAVRTENIFPIPTHFDKPSDAAKDYEKTLRKTFDINHNAFPEFDLVYLGLGDNAHTASLMPYSNVLTNSNDALVASLWVPELISYRITLTPSAINHSHTIIFLVSGIDKASAVKKVLEGDYQPNKYPAQLIQSLAGETIWYLDKPAATQLNISERNNSA